MRWDNLTLLLLRNKEVSSRGEENCPGSTPFSQAKERGTPMGTL